MIFDPNSIMPLMDEFSFHLTLNLYSWNVAIKLTMKQLEAKLEC